MDYQLNKIELGLKIKEIRKSKKMTQQQLADLIYKTESSIRKYEKGLVEIPRSVLLQIADVLGVEHSVLLGTDDFILKHKTSMTEDYYKRFEKTLEQLSLDEKLGLFSVLDKTIDYITRMNSKTDSNEALVRLNEFIGRYGEMVMNSFKLTYGSSFRENDYLLFIRNYDKCIRLINEHKDALVNSILSIQKDDNELRKLLIDEDN